MNRNFLFSFIAITVFFCEGKYKADAKHVLDTFLKIHWETDLFRNIPHTKHHESVPSEPSMKWCMSGPVDVRGPRQLFSITPLGVTIFIRTTWEHMRSQVHPEWPPTIHLHCRTDADETFEVCEHECEQCPRPVCVCVLRKRETYQVLNVSIDVFLHAWRPCGHPAAQRTELHGIRLVARTVTTLIQLESHRKNTKNPQQKCTKWVMHYFLYILFFIKRILY